MVNGLGSIESCLCTLFYVRLQHSKIERDPHSIAKQLKRERLWLLLSYLCSLRGANKTLHTLLCCNSQSMPVERLTVSAELYTVVGHWPVNFTDSMQSGFLTGHYFY